MQLNQVNALVTGGASGLGAATVRELRSRGARVTIADINSATGSALADELGEGVLFVECDVRDETQVANAVALASNNGELRVCVSCAGIAWAERVTGRGGPHPLEPFQQVIQVNLVGTFNVLRLATTAMSNNDCDEGDERGVCINTASVAAFEGQIGQIAYSASKGGVAAMTLPAARDLAARKIRVCTIAPGLFDTPLLAGLPEKARVELGKQIPHPQRLGKPSEYAMLAAHIIENPMLNGEVIRLDGALRMPPR